MNTSLVPLSAPVRYCGRLFTPEEIDSIRRLITDHPQAHRVELSRLVCQALGWMNPLGYFEKPCLPHSRSGR